MAAQLRVADASVVKRYTERDKTRLEHQWEISEVDGYNSFASAEATLTAWLDAEAFTTGDGPKALFYAAVAWLREGKVLLPGVTTVVELVAEVRQAAEDRLHDTLASAVTAEQAGLLERVLQVPEGRRRSQLDLWRRGERGTTGRGMVLALERVAQIAGLRMRDVDVAGVPKVSRPAWSTCAGARPGCCRVCTFPEHKDVQAAFRVTAGPSLSGDRYLGPAHPL